PLTSLSRAIENIINIYGNFPKTTMQFFKQTINPLFEPNEYYNIIYLKLRKLAEDENRPNFYTLAENLFYIRRLFEKDREFLSDYFRKELELLDGTEEEQLAKLADVLHGITKVHVNQIVNMIKNLQ
ncbi:MAG: hypothetical protein WAW81_02770, partial [Minisyncoccia bacterium]